MSDPQPCSERHLPLRRGPHRLASPVVSRVWPLLLALCLAQLVTRDAAAQELVVCDLYGDPDVRLESDSATILLRAALADAGAKLVPRGQLVAGITALRGKAPRYAAVPRASELVPLLKRLGARRLVKGAVVRQGSRLTARAAIFDEKGGLAGKAEALSNHGQVNVLVQELMRGLCRSLGLQLGRTPSVSVGDLQPYTAAEESLLAEDAAGSLEALETGDPALARQIPALGEVGQRLAADRSLPRADRLPAALFSGDTKTTAHLARGVLARRPTDETALAGLAWAQVLEGDVPGAQKTMARLRNPRSPMGALVQAMLAQHDKDKGLRDRMLRLALDRRYLPALRFIVTLPPGDLPLSLEQDALKLARELNHRWPALAARIGLRAARFGHRAGEGLELVQVSLLSRAEIQLLEPLVENAVKAGWSAGYRLRGELLLQRGNLVGAEGDLDRAVALQKDDLLAHRYQGFIHAERGRDAQAAASFAVSAGDGSTATRFEYARALEKAGDAPQARALSQQLAGNSEIREAIATRVELDRDGGLAGMGGKELVVARSRRLAEELVPALNAFPLLARRQMSRVLLVPRTDALQLSVWPQVVHLEHLGQGLASLLAGPAFLLRVTAADTPVEEVSEPVLKSLAGRVTADAVLIYSLQPRLYETQIRLLLYQVSTGQAFEYERTLGGRMGVELGLVSWRTLHVRVIQGLVLLVAIWLVMTLVHGSGEIKVRVFPDPAARSTLFTVQVSRSARSPGIPNVARYEAALNNRGASKGRFKATLVLTSVLFDRVPAGRWYVHMLGTFRKGVEQHMLPPDLTQEVHVRRGNTSVVTFNLEPAVVELRVSVFDGGKPVAGVPVWLGSSRAERHHTDEAGQVSLTVPRKVRHMLYVQGKDILVEKDVLYDDTTVHHMTVNLDRERQMSAFIPLETTPGIGEIPPAPPVAPAPRPSPAEELEGGGGLDLCDSEAETPVAEFPAESSGPVLISLLDRARGSTSDVIGATLPATRDRYRLKERLQSKKTEMPGGLARYKRVRELGKGGMGVVYLARDLVLERDVAVKIIGSELRSHPEARRMFVEEARAMAALNHPNLVIIFDQGWDGDDTFVVMEYVEGTSLERLLEDRGPPALAKALGYADQLCNGLSFAHTKGIIHRDIKPENIFVSTEDVVKLGDFGLAKAVSQLHIKTTKVRGTPLYMSPEQIRGKDIDQRSDIYSLGCTFYALFTGRPPFTRGEVLYHHLHTNPPRPSDLRADLPAALDELLLACMEKDKERRLGSAEELRGRLAPILAKEGWG